MLNFHLLQTFIGEQRGYIRTLTRSVPVNTNDGITDRNSATDDSAQRDPAEIIAVVEIGYQHSEKRLRRHGRRWDMPHDRFEQRPHVFVVVMQLAHGKTVF